MPRTRPSGGRPTAARRIAVPIGSNIAPALPAGYDRAAQRARGCAPDELLVAYFGFFNPSKGGATLVEALARSRRAAAPAAGGRRARRRRSVNRAYAAEVDALLDAHGLRARTHATGFVDAPEVSAALAAADVAALPYADGASPRRGACWRRSRTAARSSPRGAERSRG
jgi:glycosyltransferase involved in cell wall biosynthesis